MRYSAKGETTHTVKLTGRDILEMFVSEGFDIPVPLPAITTMGIEFEVPGGGDYSNCSVEFKNDPSVTIKWKTREDGDADLDQG